MNGGTCRRSVRKVDGNHIFGFGQNDVTIEGRNGGYFGRGLLVGMYGIEEDDEYRLTRMEFYNFIMGRSPGSQGRALVPQVIDRGTGSVFYRAFTVPVIQEGKTADELVEIERFQVKYKDLLFYDAAIVAERVVDVEDHPITVVMGNGKQTDQLMGATVSENFRVAMDRWHSYFGYEPDKPIFTSRVSLMAEASNDLDSIIVMGSVSKPINGVDRCVNNRIFYLSDFDGRLIGTATYDAKQRESDDPLPPEYGLKIDGFMSAIILGNGIVERTRNVYGALRSDQVVSVDGVEVDLEKQTFETHVVNRHPVPDKWLDSAGKNWELAKV